MTDLLRCALPTEPDCVLAEAARRPWIQDQVLAALAAARKKPTHATPILSKWFRNNRQLGSRDRPVVAEAVNGVIRHEALLLRAGARSDAELVTGWADLVAGDRFESMQSATPPEDLATALSVSFGMAREWLDRLGEDEAAQLGSALAVRAPVTVRANRLRCTREELAARLAEEDVPTRVTSWAPDGLHLERRVNVRGLASFRAGWFEVQDESSQMLVDAMPLEEGQRVLDLCAGAGGKSLALAACGAQVHAFDIRADVLQQLRRRAKRAGAKIHVGLPNPAAIVLVDAPCTGTGRLRRAPALRWGLHPEMYLAQQAELLEQARDLVADGGLLVYATCSLIGAEQVPEGFEETGWRREAERTLWPHRGGTDGFSWIQWRRLGSLDR